MQRRAQVTVADDAVDLVGIGVGQHQYECFHVAPEHKRKHTMFNIILRVIRHDVSTRGLVVPINNDRLQMYTVVDS